MSPAARRAVLAIAGLVGISCVERSTQLTVSERSQIAPFVSMMPPTPQHRLDATFENGVSLLGYDLAATTWGPGQPIRVTWYWKTDRDLEDGWRLFTHLSDGRAPTVANFDGDGVIRRLYPPGRWKVGETVRDVQDLRLPNEFTSDRAVLYLGLWSTDANDQRRLRVLSGPTDGEGRLRAVTLRVEGGSAPRVSGLPSLEVRRAASPPRIDGVLEPEVWSAAAITDELVHTIQGSPAEPTANVRALWDDEALYLAFTVEDPYLVSPAIEADAHLWEHDCVETMVDPDGDGRNYFELQVSPRGARFDTRYDSRRVPGPFGHVDWDSRLRAGVVLRGTPDDDSDDGGYDVEIAIPWAAFAAGTPPASPPSRGASWRANFYVLDETRQGPRATGWSPPLVGDFHMPPRFGHLRFVDPAGEAAARAERVERVEAIVDRGAAQATKAREAERRRPDEPRPAPR